MRLGCSLKSFVLKPLYIGDCISFKSTKFQIMCDAWIYSDGKGKLIIHEDVYIGRGFKAVLGHNDIILNAGCNIGDNVTICTQLHSKSSPDGYKNLEQITVGKGALIGSNVFIHKSVGENGRVKSRSEYNS